VHELSFAQALEASAESAVFPSITGRVNSALAHEMHILHGYGQEAPFTNSQRVIASFKFGPSRA
jgi:hypothetical protein